MKNNKKIFFLIEIVMAMMVLIIVGVMVRGNANKDLDRVSVIVQNSDDYQWSGFKYGLKMAAQDQGIEMFVVSTGARLTVEEEKRLIEDEIENGTDAVIVQPIPGDDTEKMLKKMKKKIPIMLLEDVITKDKEGSGFLTTKPDNYLMGKDLGKELLKDYGENLKNKTIGIVSEMKGSKAVMNRNQGFRDCIKGRGAKIAWSVSDSFEEEDDSLGVWPKVDIVIALDDNSLVAAGKCLAADDLHGACVYGIGNSMEAFYYLDTGFTECLVVPDEFNSGYQSLTEIKKEIGYFRHAKSKLVSHTVVRRDTLYSKENQKILFTMSQ